jgi:CspA family cold shock protein
LKTGTLKCFDEKKGYGFIISDDGFELYVHQSEIQSEGQAMLNEGQKVKYEIDEGENGPRVTKVRPC